MSIAPGARWPHQPLVDLQEDVMDIQARVMDRRLSYADLLEWFRIHQMRLTALAAEARPQKQPRQNTEAA